MKDKIDDKIKRVIQLQKDGIDIDTIASRLEFSSIQALRSFMNRNGYKCSKGMFTAKEEPNESQETDNEVADTKTKFKKSAKTTTVEKEKNPKVDTVLELQIYNVPLLTISKMVEMRDFEIEKMMDEHGYIRIADKFVAKPKPSKTKTEKKKNKTTKKKEKTKKQLLEEEYKKNPAKRGTFDPVNQVWVINVQLVEILDLQLKKVSLGAIAKQMKMTKPALIEFMEEKGYILEDDKFIQRKFAKKIIENEEEIVERVFKPRVYDDRIENIEFTEETFATIQKDLEDMLNWYKNIKEHDIFKTLKTNDMEK